MQKVLTVILAVLITIPAVAQKNKKKDQGIQLKDFKDSASYALAVMMAKNLKDQGFDNLNNDIITTVLADVMKGKVADSSLKISKEQAGAIVQQYLQKKQQMVGEDNLNKGKEFLQKNKGQSGVVELPSGIQYKVVKEGNGKKPLATDKVTVHYTGTLIDGRKFDSSKDRGEPITFPLSGVIKGWTEGLQLMSEGSTYMLYIPPHLGYGAQAPGSVIGPNSTLIFEVELIAVASE